MAVVPEQGQTLSWPLCPGLSSAPWLRHNSPWLLPLPWRGTGHLVPLTRLSWALSFLSSVRALSKAAGNIPGNWSSQTSLLSCGTLLFLNSVMAPTSQRITEQLRLEKPSKMIKSNHSLCSAKSTSTPCPQVPHPHAFGTLPGKVAGPKLRRRCAQPANVIPVWGLLEPGWHTPTETMNIQWDTMGTMNTQGRGEAEQYPPSIQQDRSTPQWCGDKPPRSGRGSAARTGLRGCRGDTAPHSFGEREQHKTKRSV